MRETIGSRNHGVMRAWDTAIDAQDVSMAGQGIRAALVVAGLWLGLAGAVAQEVVLEANQRKLNGQPWDGAEVFGPVSLPTAGPPDLALCVVPPNGQERCYEREGGRGRQSLCQNSYSCTFKPELPTGQPYGLFVYDIDLRADDLVDFVIIVPRANTPASAYAAIETRLRQLLDARTPVISPMEKDRRRRDTQVLTPEQCQQAGCTLTQSRLWLR